LETPFFDIKSIINMIIEYYLKKTLSHDIGPHNTNNAKHIWRCNIFVFYGIQSKQSFNPAE